jgi:hypothetical protein
MKKDTPDPNLEEALRLMRKLGCSFRTRSFFPGPGNPPSARPIDVYPPEGFHFGNYQHFVVLPDWWSVADRLAGAAFEPCNEHCPGRNGGLKPDDYRFVVRLSLSASQSDLVLRAVEAEVARAELEVTRTAEALPKKEYFSSEEFYPHLEACKARDELQALLGTVNDARRAAGLDEVN